MKCKTIHQRTLRTWKRGMVSPHFRHFVFPMSVFHPIGTLVPHLAHRGMCGFSSTTAKVLPTCQVRRDMVSRRQEDSRLNRSVKSRRKPLHRCSLARAMRRDSRFITRPGCPGRGDRTTAREGVPAVAGRGEGRMAPHPLRGPAARLPPRGGSRRPLRLQDRGHPADRGDDHRRGVRPVGEGGHLPRVRGGG